MQIGFRFIIIFVKRSLKLNLSSKTIMMMMIIYDDTIDSTWCCFTFESRIGIERKSGIINKGRRDHLEKYGRSNDVRR